MSVADQPNSITQIQSWYSWLRRWHAQCPSCLCIWPGRISGFTSHQRYIFPVSGLPYPTLMVRGLGIMNETYYQALSFCQRSSREGGIDAALRYNGTQLAALLVPPDVGQTYQIAAQAGKPFFWTSDIAILAFCFDEKPLDVLTIIQAILWLLFLQASTQAPACHLD